MNQLSAVKKLRRPAIKEIVQDYIQNYIIDHELRPEDALPSQGQIAKDLGVSHSSVREAVRALESLGIVEVRHGEGLYVREINFDPLLEVLSYSVMLDPSNLLDLLRIRELLEINTMPELVRRIKAKNLETCQQILTEWNENLASGLSCIEQDRCFHQTLYKVLENDLLIGLIDVFWLVYRKAEERTIPSALSKQGVLDHHREILHAIEAKDVKLAQNLMKEHFQKVEARFKIALSNSESGKEAKI
jgi:DNA-binding FadR family transcriptional regulator